jgi:hypothetical protein
MGEDALVQEGSRRLAGAVVSGHRLVRRVGTRPVQPVVRVDRHHVPVEVRVDPRREEAGDVRQPLAVVEVVVVVVAHVVDEDHDLVAVAGVVVVAAGSRERGARLAAAGVCAVAVGRDAELGRLLRVDVALELVGQVVDLRVGEHVAHAVVSAVACLEIEDVRDPHLGVSGHRPQREETVADQQIAVARVPELLRPQGRRAHGGRRLRRECWSQPRLRPRGDDLVQLRRVVVENDVAAGPGHRCRPPRRRRRHERKRSDDERTHE